MMENSELPPIASHTPQIYTVGIRNLAFDDTSAGDQQQGNGVPQPSVPDERKDELTRLMSRQDAGYAWVILGAAVLGRIIMGNGQAIMGLLILELKNSFDASTAELVAASTTQVGIAMTTTMVSSLCLPYIGVRATIIGGTLVVTAGYVATCFATSTVMFFLTYSVVVALGTSFCTYGFLFPLTHYFDKHRSLALGFFVSSLNIGNFIWPPIVNELFRYYGWRGSFLILAGIQLNMCVLGALERPFWIPKSMRDSAHHKPDAGGCAPFGKLITDGKFMFLNLIMLTGFIAYSFGPAYMPTLAEGIGASDTEGALLVSVQGIVTVLSGLFHGFLSDRRWFRDNLLVLLIYSFVISAVAKMFLVQSTAYWQLLVFAVLDGYSLGGYTAPGIALCVAMVRPELGGQALGINAMAIGWSMIAGSLLSGWLFGHFGSLLQPAITLGSLQLLGTFLSCILFVMLKRSKKTNTIYDVTPM